MRVNVFLTTVFFLAVTCLTLSEAQAQEQPRVMANACAFNVTGDGEWRVCDGSENCREWRGIPENGVRYHTRGRAVRVQVRGAEGRVENYPLPANRSCRPRTGPSRWDEQASRDAQQDAAIALNVDNIAQNRVLIDNHGHDGDYASRDHRHGEYAERGHEHDPQDSPRDDGQDERLTSLESRRCRFQGGLSAEGFFLLPQNLEMMSGATIQGFLGTERVNFHAGVGVDFLSMGLVLDLGVDTTVFTRGNNSLYIPVTGMAVWEGSLSDQEFEARSEYLVATTGLGWNVRWGAFSMDVDVQGGVYHRRAWDMNEWGAVFLVNLSFNVEFGENYRSAEEGGE